jgi:hypothetical protein
MPIKTSETFQITGLADKYLYADSTGTCVGKTKAEVQSDIGTGSSVSVVQETGTSTSSVMSQNAVTTALDGKVAMSTLTALSTAVNTALAGKADLTGNPISAFMITDSAGTLSAITLAAIKQVILQYPFLSADDAETVSNLADNTALTQVIPVVVQIIAAGIAGMYTQGVQNQASPNPDIKTGVKIWVGEESNLPMNQEDNTLYFTLSSLS